MPKMSKSFNVESALKRSMIPDGDYSATILATDIRIEGDAADEETLVVQFAIFDGSGEDGRQVYEWFRVNSASKPVREIAEKSLAQLLGAVGVHELVDTEDLHDKQLVVRVTTQVAAGYLPRNRYAYLPSSTPMSA